MGIQTQYRRTGLFQLKVVHLTGQFLLRVFRCVEAEAIARRCQPGGFAADAQVGAIVVAAVFLRFEVILVLLCNRGLIQVAEAGTLDTELYFLFNCFCAWCFFFVCRYGTARQIVMEIKAQRQWELKRLSLYPG